MKGGFQMAIVVEENEGMEVFCPYCGKPVIVPAGYNRPTYLCPRCHKAIPLSEKMLEELSSSAKLEEKPRVTSPCRRDSLR